MRWYVAGALAAATSVLASLVAACGSTAPAFHAGECVRVGVDSTGNGTINQVSCTQPGDLDKVLQVVSGTSGTCTMGDRTFQDEVSNQTYCLEDIYVFGEGNAGAGGSNGAANSPAPSPAATFAYGFCAPAWSALKQMNGIVHEGKVNQFGDETWPSGVWPGSATISHWNEVLATLNQEASSAGQGEISSDAFQAQMQPGYNPATTGDSSAIGLGNETLNIAMACAPNGKQTGISTVDSYTTFDGFTWYPGD